MPYDIRPQADETWSVIDLTSGQLVEHNGGVLVGLSLADADEAADLLTQRETEAALPEAV